MIQFEILTPWTGTGTEDDPNRPQIADDYDIKKYEDTTGQAAANLYPNPNLFVAKIECEDAVFEAIDADDNYCVLWSSPVAKEEII